MAYNFQSRLNYANSRFKELNYEKVQYVRGATILADVFASPILHKAEEMSPGSVNVYRVDIQSWGIDVAEIATLFPPKESDRIIRADGSEYRVLKNDNDAPLFVYTTSTRERIVLHTKCTKR